MTILTDENYVDKAERAISLLEKDNKGNHLLTTSQIEIYYPYVVLYMIEVKRESLMN